MTNINTEGIHNLIQAGSYALERPYSIESGVHVKVKTKWISSLRMLRNLKGK